MCNVSTPPFGITCQSDGFPRILAKFLTVVVELTTPAAFGHDGVGVSLHTGGSLVVFGVSYCIALLTRA